MTRIERIAQAIARTEDRALLRLLSRAWWAEYFRQQRMLNSQLRKAA